MLLKLLLVLNNVHVKPPLDFHKDTAAVFFSFLHNWWFQKTWSSSEININKNLNPVTSDRLLLYFAMDNNNKLTFIAYNIHRNV